MKALLIEFDLRTGTRAGGIDPRDRGLRCVAQRIVDGDAREIRVVDDGRDTSAYDGVDGVSVLDGVAAVNAKIAEIFVVSYAITNETLFSLSVQQRGIALSDYDGLSDEDMLAALYDAGVRGISRSEAPAVSE